MSKKLKGVKGEFTQAELNDYLNTEFKDGVINWNKKCGRDITELDDLYEVLKGTINQGKRVLEESIEGLSAFLNKDKTEQLDSLVDILVTNIMFEEYHKQTEVIKSKLGDEEFGKLLQETVLAFDPNDLLVLEVVQGVLSTSLVASEGINQFTPKRVYLACQLILENNDQKVTSDKAIADDWKVHRKEGEKILETDFNEVIYYSIIRVSDNKTCKPYNFKPVTLEVH